MPQAHPNPGSRLPGPVWPALAPTTLADAAYHAVREQILAGNLARGEFIRERSVSAALRISRTPLREAFSRLATEGFLERAANRGYRVPEAPLDDLLHLYPIVTALELTAARESLASTGPNDLVALKILNRAMVDAIADHDATRAIRTNEDFHRRLTAHCTNPRLTKMLDDLRSQLSGLEIWSATQPELNTEAMRQHRDIVKALTQGDTKRALRVLEANRMQTFNALRAAR